MVNSKTSGVRQWPLLAALALLLAIFAAELALSTRQQSQTFDEAAHIFAGYRSWKNFDFGINPEHPPLVKLVAAIPLLRMPLMTQPVPDGYFKFVEYQSGREFLYANDADAVLFRARFAAAIFTLFLALAVFFVGRSMWGDGPAFLATTLLVFEPNFLAHGALVTTDVGAALGIFLAVGCFYFYQKKTSGFRLVVAGLATGVCLGVKYSGILIFPMLLLLAVFELMPFRDPSTRKWSPDLWKKGLRQISSLAIISGIALVVLWSFYGFRYAARAPGQALNPPLAAVAPHLGSTASAVILQAARWHLLPESYLYGFVDVYSSAAIPTFLLGKVYPAAQWFYFPAIFAIKSTVAFLLLCCLALLSKPLRDKIFRREVAFLILPVLIYLAAAFTSGINYGVRHLLPIYPFLIILAAAGAWNMAQRGRAVAIFVALILALHIGSSLRVFPNYLSYANELWGGSQNAPRILADSNADWGQGLKGMQQYITQHQIKDCWFAYFGTFVADPAYYGIPCKTLPASFANLFQFQMPIVPQSVDGPVFLSSSEIAGPYWGGDWANPYLPFRAMHPTAVIANSILVFDGKFDMSLASAVTHENLSGGFLRSRQLDQALAEADTAVASAPNTPGAHGARGNVLMGMNRRPEALSEFFLAAKLRRAAMAQK